MGGNSVWKTPIFGPRKWSWSMSRNRGVITWRIIPNPWWVRCCKSPKDDRVEVSPLPNGLRWFPPSPVENTHRVNRRASGKLRWKKSTFFKMYCISYWAYGWFSSPMLVSQTTPQNFLRMDALYMTTFSKGIPRPFWQVIGNYSLVHKT